MTKLWIAIGRVAYIVTWPGIWLVVRLTPPRTRVLVIHNGYLLLVRDWLGNGTWKLPGGGLHRHEPAQIGAIRELKEETGIDLDTVPAPGKIKYMGDFSSRSNGINVHIVCFMVKLKSKPVLKLPPLEISDYTWIPLADLPEANLSHTTEVALEYFGHFC